MGHLCQHGQANTVFKLFPGPYTGVYLQCAGRKAERGQGSENQASGSKQLELRTNRVQGELSGFIDAEIQALAFDVQVHGYPGFFAASEQVVVDLFVDFHIPCEL